MDNTTEVLYFYHGGNKKLFYTEERPLSVEARQLSVQGVSWAISPGVKRPELEGEFLSPTIS